MHHLLRVQMPWIYPSGNELFTSLVSGGSGDCLLSDDTENRFLHHSKIQMSIFTTGDTIYLKWAASRFPPRTSVAQHLETGHEWHREEWDRGQGASLLQTQVPKPAGTICSAAPETSQAAVSCLSHTPSFCWKTPWAGLSNTQLPNCNRYWNRESSEIKDLTYDLLFYIAFSLPFANFWSCKYLSMYFLPFSLPLPHLDLTVKARVLPMPQYSLLAKRHLEHHREHQKFTDTSVGRRSLHQFINSFTLFINECCTHKWTPTKENPNLIYSEGRCSRNKAITSEIALQKHTSVLSYR